MSFAIRFHIWCSIVFECKPDRLDDSKTLLSYEIRRSTSIPRTFSNKFYIFFHLSFRSAIISSCATHKNRNWFFYVLQTAIPRNQFTLTAHRARACGTSNDVNGLGTQIGNAFQYLPGMFLIFFPPCTKTRSLCTIRIHTRLWYSLLSPQSVSKTQTSRTTGSVHAMI